MAASIHARAYKPIIQAFIEARTDAGIFQADLAKLIGRDQSFISRIENGQRRLDVLEAFVIARAMGYDPVEFMARLVAKVPAKATL